MLFVLILGLVGIFAPGYIMAMAGMSAHMEEDAALAGCFRIFGVLLVGIAVYFMFFR